MADKEKPTVTRKRRRLYETPDDAKIVSETKKAEKKKKDDTPEDVPVYEEHKTDDERRKLEAYEKIRNYSYGTAGGSIIPIPLLNMGAVVGLQVKLVNEIAKIYNVSVRKGQAKSVVISLLSTIGAHSMATGSLRSLLWFVPVVGPLVSSLSFPIFSGAITYAMGIIFLTHFKAGGTLEDFKASDFALMYRREFEKAKDVMKEK